MEILVEESDAKRRCTRRSSVGPWKLHHVERSDRSGKETTFVTGRVSVVVVRAEPGEYLVLGNVPLAILQGTRLERQPGKAHCTAQIASAVH